MSDRLFGAVVWTVMVVCLGLLTRFVGTAILNKTLRVAFCSHPASVPMLVRKIEERQPWADKLLGVILIAAGAGVAPLAFFDSPGDRFGRIETAFLLAMMGWTALIYARLQHSLLAERLRTGLEEHPEIAPLLPATPEPGNSWADVVLAVIVVAIIMVFGAITLIGYWQDYPAEVVVGLLIALGTFCSVRIARRRKAAADRS